MSPLAATIQAPTIEYAKVAPLLIVFCVAVLGVLVEAAAPRERRYVIQVGLALAGLVASLVAVVALAAAAPS